jgi:CRP-like cAMP-binding protein
MNAGSTTCQFIQLFNTVLMDQTNACSRCITREDCVFSSLPHDSPVTGKALVHERRFHRGDVLRTQGDAADTVQMVKVGSVLASRTGVDGISRSIAIFCRGAAMGRFEPFDTTNVLTCRAISSGRLCEVRIDEMGSAVTKDFQDLMLDRQIRTFGLLADWAQIMRIKGVTGQVAAALVQLERCQRINGSVQLPGHSALAGLLGTSRETIARVLGQIELTGALTRLDRTHCKINRAKLIALLAS